jgi:hypothetical protein
MKKVIVGMICCLFYSTFLFALDPDTLWTKTYGGADNDCCHSVQQTADNGYIMAGWTYSFGSGGPDAWLIKTDANGDTLWTKTYGGADLDYGRSVQKTSDNGYIIVGDTYSYGSGGPDAWLIKTDANGDTLWTKTYGGVNNDYSYSVQQTTDNGYIVAGWTYSFGSGNNDVWLLKTDQNGDTLWTKTYGGANYEYGITVQQTADTGYIITGYTKSFGAGDYDVWLLKTDQNGDTLWTKTYGGAGTDLGYTVQQTTDSGYIIVGYTVSFGSGGPDAWLIKTDANGDTLWTKTYGGTNIDVGQSVQQTADNGYIITGNTWSYGSGLADVYLIKTDVNGDTLWTKTYGGTGYDVGESVQQTTGNGCIIVGTTDSFGAGISDVWLLRITGVVDVAPEILSVTDIPNDQGRWVRVTWAASLYDQPGGTTPITQYGIWRRIDEDDKGYATYREENDFVIAGIEDSLEGWDAVGMVPAIQDSIYNFVSPTLGDSNATGMYYSVFLITAHTQDPYVWFASEPDSGYSVDNIPPETPYNLAGEVINSDVLLTWQIELYYPDFSHFAVYRDTVSGFTPGDVNRIGTSEVSTYTDSSLAVDTYYYVVSAFDINGNESDCSNEAEVTVTGITELEPAIPTVYALSQNYPNPFKTETAIHYQLPQPGNVTIAIYNVSGQRVKTLVNETREPGYYAATWNGQSETSQKASNGVYFCRMQAGEYTSVKKILLAR